MGTGSRAISPMSGPDRAMSATAVRSAGSIDAFKRATLFQELGPKLAIRKHVAVKCRIHHPATLGRANSAMCLAHVHRTHPDGESARPRRLDNEVADLLDQLLLDLEPCHEVLDNP